MRTRLVGIVAVLALVATGCGDDNETASTSTTTGGETPTTADGDSSSTVASSGGEQDAEKLVLKQSDLPSGWTSTPADPDQPGVDPAEEELEKCLGAELSDDEDSVDSPDFEKDESRVSSSAGFADSEDELEADWKAIQSDKFLPCLKEQLEAELAKDEDVKYEDTTVAEFPYPDLGDGTRAVRVRTTGVADGQRIPAYFDVVFIRKGLAKLTLTFVNLGATFDADLAEDLGRKVVARA